MKVVVNPKYATLTEFMKGVIKRSYTPGEVYRASRNTVEEVQVGGYRLVVKRFKKPVVFNRWVYTFIRPTKAKRSYNYSLKLLDMGFTVPEPVGYVEEKKGGLFHTGVYVSLYTDYKAVAEFNNPALRTLDNAVLLASFVRNLAAFAAKLHSKGVLHGDFNSSNILYKIEDRKWKFALIDLNRAKFGIKSWRKFAKDIGNLSLDYELIAMVIKEYATIREINVKLFALHAIAQINRYRLITKWKDRILCPLGLRKRKLKD